MPWWLINLYADELPPLAAEEALLALNVADYPHQEKSGRKSIRRPYANILGGEEGAKLDLASEGGKATAAGLGIGVRGIES